VQQTNITCPEALGVQPPQGLKRARRLDPELRAELAQGAGAGSKRRKSQSTADAMEDRKRAAAATPAAAIASFQRRPGEHQVHMLARYWAESRQRLQSSVVTVTVDGSRVGQEGILVLAAWSPQNQCSMWLPPQVRALGCRVVDFVASQPCTQSKARQKLSEKFDWGAQVQVQPVGALVRVRRGSPGRGQEFTRAETEKSQGQSQRPKQEDGALQLNFDCDLCVIA
jgi:hypothetical protein